MAHLAHRTRLLSGNVLRGAFALATLLLAAHAWAEPSLASRSAERELAMSPAEPVRAQAVSSYDPLWAGYPLPGMSGSVRAIRSHDGLLVVAGDGNYFGTTIARRIASWDGISWQAIGDGLPVPVNALATYGTRLIAGGLISTSSTPGVGEKPAIFSWDGSTWTTIGNPNGSVDAMIVIGSDLYVGGTFVSVNGVPAARIARWDGTNWFAVGAGFASGSTVRALAAHGGNVIAGGTIAAYQGIAKWNGATWSTVGAGLQNGTSAGVTNSLVSDGTTLYASGNFNSSGGSPVTNTVAWNGSTWSGLAGGNVAANALIMYGGFPMSTVQTSGIQSPQLWNGAAWQPFNQPNMSPLAYGYHGITLYAGASPFFTGPAPFALDRFYAFDGSTWTIQQQAWQSGMRGFHGQGYCAQAWQGSLYVGGTMGHFGTGGAYLRSPGVGKWDGATWSAIGPGRQHFDLTVWNDSLVASCDDRVRVWNGTSWRQLSVGAANVNSFDTFANPLVVYQGQLYAVGPHYLSPSSTFVQMIVRWTGSNWVGVAPGIDDVNGVAFTGVQWGSSLVVGGQFNSAAGSPARNLVAWNGTTTQEVGGGVNDYVSTVIADGADLIVGGIFTEAGGDSVRAVARWDGAAWHAMGTRAVTVNRLRSHAGRIYAAGVFLDDNSVAIGGAAVWTGAEWQLLGSGVDAFGVVNTIEFLGDDLYIVGAFNRANGHPARSFAKLANVSTLGAPVPPSRPSRLALAPSRNPSRGSVTLSVSLPSSGRARLTIHDVMGREVARLLDGVREAGVSSCTWDARVAPGLYLAVLESGGERASTRLVRLR